MPASSMRHEPSFLKHILSARRKIEAIVVAVLHHLTVIGEAISRLSAEKPTLKLPWRQIIAPELRPAGPRHPHDGVFGFWSLI